MEISVLGSGSKGNSVFFRSERCQFLVDAGLSARQTKLRLAEIGMDGRDLDFILITHEHSDHISGVPRLVKLYEPRIFANNATFAAMGADDRVRKKHFAFDTGESFDVKDVNITPLPVSHNAADPVSFVIGSENVRCAVLTDLGYVSRGLLERLRGVDALFIESNYDTDMLMSGSYPLFLKRRISGLTGHLSNKAAADAIVKLEPKEDNYLFLNHLSENNNHPDIAYSCVREVMETRDIPANNLFVSDQKKVSPLLKLTPQ